MARKKANTEVKEEVIDVEAKQVEEAANTESEEKEQLGYVMNVLNDAREGNETSFIWNGIEIKVKKFLNIFEMKVLYDGILSRCFSTEDGSFQPEYRDFAERATTIVVHSDIQLPEAVSDQYDLVFKTDLYYCVADHIDMMQQSAVLDAVDEKVKEIIEYRANEALKNAEAAIEAVNNLVDSLDNLFDGISPEEISGLVKAISENGIDEKAIVDAVINK